MHGHISAGLLRCAVLFVQGKLDGFCHIDASAYSEFFCIGSKILIIQVKV